MKAFPPLRSLALLVLTLLPLAFFTGCDGAERSRTFTVAAYTTPREVYGNDILPAFANFWRQKTGEKIKIHESYQGSGAQARAVIGGLDADVAMLSLAADVDKIAKAGLISGDWRLPPTGGTVTRSVVVIAVRKGNPKNIRDWTDLGRADVEVLTPNPRTSGGAMWNLTALYGAALRGFAGTPPGDRDAAERLVTSVVKRVRVMDSGARESMLTFERGVGDAAITYENEVLVAIEAGRQMDYVIPSSTVLIENPAAEVTAYTAEHGTHDLAKGFLDYLQSAEAQLQFARKGLRPVDPAVAAEFKEKFPPPADLFTVEDMGGWEAISSELFGKGAVFERAMAAKRVQP